MIHYEKHLYKHSFEKLNRDLEKNSFLDSLKIVVSLAFQCKATGLLYGYIS